MFIIVTTKKGNKKMFDYNQQINSLQTKKQKLKDEYEQKKKRLQLKIQSLKIAKTNEETRKIKNGK